MTPAGAGGPDAGELALLAEEAARRAGELVRAATARQITVDHTKSSPTDVVTATDQAAEQLLRTFLAERRPGDGVLGEEAGQEPGESALTWVVDPVDGTVNFLYGIPAYAVSVAVVTGRPAEAGAWETVAGCVFDVTAGTAYTAARGEGARRDGVPLRPPARPVPGLDQALVATGFGYRRDRRRAQARVLLELLPQVRDVRRVGSSALDLCGVAEGRYDAYYERGLNAWDYAAALLVATESGVAVSGGAGRPPSGDLLVAARPPLHDVLAERLVALGADTDEPAGQG